MSVGGGDCAEMCKSYLVMPFCEVAVSVKFGIDEIWLNGSYGIDDGPKQTPIGPTPIALRFLMLHAPCRGLFFLLFFIFS